MFTHDLFCNEEAKVKVGEEEEEEEEEPSSWPAPGCQA